VPQGGVETTRNNKQVELIVVPALKGDSKDIVFGLCDYKIIKDINTV
jgi:hypothetical protein